jgi:hypothetical protein
MKTALFGILDFWTGLGKKERVSGMEWSIVVLAGAAMNGSELAARCFVGEPLKAVRLGFKREPKNLRILRG